MTCLLSRVGGVITNPTFAIRTRFCDDLLLAESGERHVRQEGERLGRSWHYPGRPKGPD